MNFHAWSIQKLASVLSLGLFLIYGTILYQLKGPLTEGYSDFVSFYTAGKILQRGTPERLYDTDLQYKIQREVAPNVRIRQRALPFVRPAFEAWIFWPLAYLPYTAALVLWNIFSCACVILTLLILRREIPELLKIGPSLMVASSVSYFPVFFTLLQGQDSLLLLLIYVLGFRALRREQPFSCGLTLGLGVFKFPLVIPFLIPFVFKRKLHVLLGFALTSLLLAVISVATTGWSTAAYYPKYLLSIDYLARGVNRPQDMPNLRGLLSVLLPTVSRGTTVVLLVLLSILLLVFIVRNWFFSSSGRGDPMALGFALNLVATVLVSYHCHVFDLSLLLLPLSLAVGFVLSDELVAHSVRRLLIWMICFLMFSPLYLVLTFSLSTPSLLGVLLLGFACSLGMTISELRIGALQTAAESSKA
jgi:Glycosyltransferase family 87